MERGACFYLHAYELPLLLEALLFRFQVIYIRFLLTSFSCCLAPTAWRVRFCFCVFSLWNSACRRLITFLWKYFLKIKNSIEVCLTMRIRRENVSEWPYYPTFWPTCLSTSSHSRDRLCWAKQNRRDHYYKDVFLNQDIYRCKTLLQVRTKWSMKNSHL